MPLSGWRAGVVNRSRRYPVTASVLPMPDKPGVRFALSLGSGIRTGEAPALPWEHVDFGDPSAPRPRAASVAGLAACPRRHQDTEVAAHPRPPGLRRAGPGRLGAAR